SLRSFSIQSETSIRGYLRLSCSSWRGNGFGRELPTSSTSKTFEQYSQTPESTSGSSSPKREKTAQSISSEKYYNQYKRERIATKPFSRVRRRLRGSRLAVSRG